MIEHFNPEQLSGPDEVTGDIDVGLAQLGVAAGMVVDEDDGAGPAGDGHSEDFPGMDQDGVEQGRLDPVR